MRQKGKALRIVFGNAAPFGQLTVQDKHNKHNGTLVTELSAIVEEGTLTFSVKTETSGDLAHNYTYKGNFTIEWIEVTYEG